MNNYDTSLIQKNTEWKAKIHSGRYKIIKVEREMGIILNIKLQNINNKSLIFDIGDYELLTGYEYVRLNFL